MRISIVLAALLVSSACKNKEPDKAAPAAAPAAAAPAAKLVELDASPAGERFKGWKLQAPEGASAKEDFGALAVKAGDGFQLEVNSGAVDMAARKKEIASNDVNKLKRYVVEAPDTLIYESEVMDRSEFHFVSAIKIGAEDWSCENAKGPTYTQAQIQAMVDACKSIHK